MTRSSSSVSQASLPFAEAGASSTTSPIARCRVGLSLLYVSFGRMGGAATYAVGILRELLARGQHDYFLFTPSRMMDRWKDLLPTEPASFIPCDVHPDSRPRRVLFEQFRLPGEARRRAIDVVYFPHMIAPRWRTPASVVTIYDLLFLSGKATDFSWSKRRYLEWTHRQFRGRDCHVVTISEFCREDIHRRLAIPLDRIGVTPIGIDPVFRQASMPPAAELASLPTHYFLSVAAAYPHKRLDIAIAAFEQIAQPHESLVLAGTRSGTESSLKRLLGRIAASPKQARIHVLPPLPRHALPELYSRAIGLVSASEFEGFGIPAVEAMAVGCPVAASPAEAIVEVLGGNGWLASDFTAEALATVMREIRQVRQREPRKIERARERAFRLYAWENAATALEAALATAASRHGHAHSV